MPHFSRSLVVNCLRSGALLFGLLGTALANGASAPPAARIASQTDHAQRQADKTPVPLKPSQFQPDVPAPAQRINATVVGGHAKTSARMQNAVDCNSEPTVTHSLTGEALLARLDSFAPDCMNSSTVFFAIDANTFQFYSNDNMQTVIAALSQRVASYVPSPENTIHPLLVYLRAANYVAYYSGGNLVHSEQTYSRLQEALLQFSEGAYFSSAASAHGTLMADFFKAADLDNRRAAIAPKVFAYLAAMSSADTYRNEGQYQASYGLYSFLFRARSNNDEAFIRYVESQAATIAATMKRAALFFNLPLNPGESRSPSVSFNAVNEYSGFLFYPALKAWVEDGLPEVLQSLPHFSGPWLAAAGNIDYYHADCVRLSMCKTEVSAQLRARVFPYLYSFDDGKVLMHTAVPLSTAQQLYHAMKQVEAQYKRTTQDISPLSDDKNAVLTMYIYGSRADYENSQYYLFGLGTDNGGIYIESDGTFYTYERTSQDSIYTLEELLRHEYVHYLSARFTEHGVFGDEHYANNRLTWFDEGIAEFFAGSTQADGVKVRKIMVSQISSDGAARLTVSQILQASYGDGFKFYRYAALFFNYLNEARYETLLLLHQRLRADDLPGFDALVNELRSDNTLAQSYQAFLDRQVAQLDTMSGFVEGEKFDSAYFRFDDAAQIQDGLRANGLPDATCTSTYLLINARAGCVGSLGSTAPGKQLDNTILALLSTQIGNWRTLVCTHGAALNGKTPYYCEAGLRAKGTPVPPALFVIPSALPPLTLQPPLAPPPRSASGLPLLWTWPTVASGMGAYYEVGIRAITLRWANPSTGGSYALTLKNGSQTIYYGGHSIDSASVDFTRFGLAGTETLRGHFSEYAANRSWVKDFPEFVIELAKVPRLAL